ncbi:phage major capsid protein [Demequina rhizosphaerae]|uniref:phage major capsid protein n=1 Tax=Demequina rhizosphaerae TaxID=1638985 RepID=UPI000A782B2A|nr:phage major capsid protein [Demequina rhizosphaerae]
MAMFTTTSDVSGITPDDYGPLIVQPVQRESVAYQVSTLLTTDSTRVNLPIVTADPSAGWFAEGADITLSDQTLDELTVTPAKVAGLTKISNELASDSSPTAASIVGAGIARDIVSKVDAAFFGNTVTNGPSGLESLTGVSEVDTAGAYASFDVFAEAISKAEEVGATIGAFVTDPATALVIAKLKQATGSNMPMLGTSATDALDRRILGVPLLVSSAVTTGTTWGIPKAASYVVQRGGAELDVDRSVYFASYSTAVRAVMRVGYGFVHEAAIVKIYDAS